MQRGEIITAERLREIMSYDASTGEFRWLADMGSRGKPGGVAGTANPNGYRNIIIFKRSYLAHRLAWLHSYGQWPEGDTDHINGNKSDNRLANLREATRASNMHNKTKPRTNTSGFKGVSFHKPTGRWRARIQAEYSVKYLGQYATAEDAATAYARAAKEYHGEFWRTE